MASTAPTIRRETDPDLMRMIACSEGVREFVGIDVREPDWSILAILQQREGDGDLGVRVLSNGRDALAVFHQTAPGIFQSHTMFAQTCRGRAAIDTGRAMVRWMFDHGADVVWGATPRENRAARWFNRQIGAHTLPTSDDEGEVFEIKRENYDG